MSLKNYAEAVITGREEEYNAEQGAYLGEHELFGAYVGDSPDSAIGLYDEPVLKTLKDAMMRHAGYGGHTIDDITEEELTDIPSRPPTPPPKDLKRLELARRSMISPFDVTVESPPTDNHFGVDAEISSSSMDSISPTTTMTTATKSKNSRFSKFLGHVRRSSVERTTALAPAPAHHQHHNQHHHHHHHHLPSITRSRSTADIRPSTPVLQGSLVRRGRRLSVNFKKLPMWNVEIDQLIGPGAGAGAGPGPQPSEGGMEAEAAAAAAVFGVSLQKSIQVARGTAKTHHSGGGRASRREYPLCVQRCCLFIKEEGGVEAPHIFGEPGDPSRVRRLKEAFSRGPSYGRDLDWYGDGDGDGDGDGYGPHDAAELVLLFLSQLPKPLVSASAARRWVALSRQAAAAAAAGSQGTRSEQCIDFWEEALGAVRGDGAARSLLKLLLNLWADVAAAADRNDMTAERLAACVLKPLMHVSPSDERHRSDYVLALAFLIRRRTEYVDMLRSDQEVAATAAATAAEGRRTNQAAW